MRRALEWPLQKGDKYKRLGLQPPKGVLLYGPPGCAKTTIARAAASAAGVAFLAFSPSDVYASSFVGEAERTVRDAFKLARATNPCVLFFDEIDAIVGAENNETSHGMNRAGRLSAEARVLSSFLNEMDGVDGTWQDGVMVLAATNRPWTLDKALLRSGRFDKAIYVPPPDHKSRCSIMKMFCGTYNIEDKDIDNLAGVQSSGSMTGAEIAGACRAAGVEALKQALNQPERRRGVEVTVQDLRQALAEVQPLLSQFEYLDSFLEFERSRLLV